MKTSGRRACSSKIKSGKLYGASAFAQIPPQTRIFFKSQSIEMDYGVAEIINRVIKYLIEGLVVAAAALLIPRKSLGFDEVASLAVLAAVVFAILDVVSPSMGMTARQGASFGIGANLVGFPRGL
jgi:hypothetical protein